MKIKIEKISSFIKIIEMVNSVNYKIKEDEPSKINEPSICIRTSGGQVFVVAMNQEMYFNVSINAQIEEEGIVVISNTVFIKTLKAITANNITLSSDNENLHFINENNDVCASIKLLECKKFDKLPIFSGKKQISVLQAGLLAECMKVVSNNIGNSVQESLNNACLEFELVSVDFIGFDGYRLIKKSIELLDEGTDIDFKETMFIPVNAAGAVAKILQKGKADVTISYFSNKNKNYFVIEKEGVIMAIRLNQIDYPNYKTLLTQSFDFSFSFSQKELRKTMKSVTGLSDSKEVLPIHFIFKENVLELRIVTNDSTVSQKIELTSKENVSEKFKLSAKDMKSILPAFPDDICIKVSKKGLVTIESGEEDNNIIFITRTLL